MAQNIIGRLITRDPDPQEFTVKSPATPLFVGKTSPTELTMFFKADPVGSNKAVTVRVVSIGSVPVNVATFGTPLGTIIDADAVYFIFAEVAP